MIKKIIQVWNDTTTQQWVWRQNFHFQESHAFKIFIAEQNRYLWLSRVSKVVRNYTLKEETTPVWDSMDLMCVKIWSTKWRSIQGWTNTSQLHFQTIWCKCKNEKCKPDVHLSWFSSYIINGELPFLPFFNFTCAKLWLQKQTFE